MDMTLAQQTFEILFANIHPMAETSISEEGTLVPFALVSTSKGKLKWIRISPMPKINPLDYIKKTLAQDWENRKIDSFAIAWHAKGMSSDGRKSDVLVIDMEHHSCEAMRATFPFFKSGSKIKWGDPSMCPVSPEIMTHE